MLRTGVLAAALFLAFAAPAPAAAPPRVVLEEFQLPSDTPGVSLYVREKHPAGARFGHVLLMVHGATYPAETAFDLPLDGISWMDDLAAHGFDVYCMDVRGYGRSTRPPEMDRPADQNPPLVRTDVAARDYATVAAFVRARRKVEKIDLLGWSWGTTIAAVTAIADTPHVGRLVLYAPQWVKSPPVPPPATPPGAYRTVTVEQAKDRWEGAVVPLRRDEIIPPAWFDAWARATFATDPGGAAQRPPVLRAPNGIVADNIDYWNAGKPYYDPAEIRVPTLIVHAEDDRDLPASLARGLFAKLTNAPEKRYVEIGSGTHHVLMERNRFALFREVRAFLDDDRT